MAINVDDYIAQRKRELGVTSASFNQPDVDSYIQNRKMDLGLIPDTRKPMSVAIPAENKVNAPTQVSAMDVARSAQQAVKSPALLQLPSTAQRQIAKNDAARAAAGGPKWLQNAAHAVDKFMLENPVGKGITRFGQSAARVFGITPESIGNMTISTGNKGVDTALDLAGGAAGYVVNPAQIEQNLVTGSYGAARSALNTGAGQRVETGLQNAAARITGRVAPAISPRVTDRAVTGLLEGGAANALQNAAVGAMAGQTDAGDVARNAVIGGTLGGAADAGLGVIGPILKGSKLGQRVAAYFAKSDAVPESTKELLALPAPRERGNPNTAVTPEVIRANGKVEPIGLPAPELSPPTTGRLERRPGLNAVLEEIKPIVEERMTPPFENPNELAKWIQKNIGLDDASLNEVRQLSYEDMRQLAEEIRGRFNVYDLAVQVAKEKGHDLERLLNPRQLSPDVISRSRERQERRNVYGVPSPIPVRTLDDRYQGGVLSPAAAPVERVGRSSFVQPIRPSTPRETIASASSPAIDTQMRPEVAAVMNEPLNQAEIPFSITEPASINSAADTFDDIEINPDEIAPRVRDRLSGYADNLIASAKEELARSRNRLSSNPTDLYAQYAKIGAGYMLKGTVKLADFTEQMVKEFGEEIKPHIREIFKRAKAQYNVYQKQIESEELGLTGFEGQDLKDISSLNLNTSDVYRNFKKVFGDAYPAVKKAVLDPFDEAKGAFAREQHKLTDELDKDIVKGLGIKKGSKLSADVQKYGEGELSVDDIKAEYPNKYKDIIRADQWFRQHYNDLIDRVNQTVASIYPNNPDKLVPRRQDYYRHFKDLSDWSGLKSLFDNVSGISPQLAGISPYTKPKTKWASFKQQRGLGEFKNDAVGGFLDYVPAAAYAIHIDPHINVFRNLAKRLKEDTAQTKNLNNFTAFLENFANDLAGKTSPMDRWAEFIDPFTNGGGRKALQLLTQINNRVKSNMILGNARSTLSQLANIPNGVAYGGIDAPVGALKTIQSIFEPNAAMEESNFLKERYLGKTMRRFNQKWWEQPKRFAEWMMETSDRVGTSFVWNTSYAKAIRQGETNPIKFADEQTRRLVGGRGIGEQPLLIKSKTFNLIAPFQLEVNNLWRIMKDFTDEKRFGALATLFAANWLLNEAFKKTTGSGVTLDPIDAIYDASTENTNFFNRLGRVGGEALSNLPFGQTLASIYPEYGMNIAGVQLPTREAFFGDKDPTRFGSGLLATKAITDPVYNFLLPFGGGQLKKTIEGADALARGGTYTDNVLTTGPTIEQPKLKYPIAPTPANTLRALAFNPNATSEGQRYNQEDLRPLSENQTRTYQNAPNPRAYYEYLMSLRQQKSKASK